MNPSSISRRIESCIACANNKEYETALIHFFPALDKTAKRRRSKDGVGSRIKKFIADQEAIISAVATNNIFLNINIDGVSFPDAIYKFGRTSIAHEGELDPRLTINDTGLLTIGHVWNLPSSYITGLIVGVMVAPENSGEKIESNLGVTLFGNEFSINELWGAEKKIQQITCDVFRNQEIFK